MCAKSLRLEVSGRRSRGRPKKRWRDNIPGDLKIYELAEDMAQDRKFWMTKIMAGPAQGEVQERREAHKCVHIIFEEKAHYVNQRPKMRHLSE